MHEPVKHFFGIHMLVKLRSELEEIYLNQVIQTFATSLIGVFIPIYLLNLGFSLSTTLFYYILALGTMGILSPVSAAIASRIGLKHTILLRLPLSVIFYFSLMLLGFLPSFSALAALALVGGLSDALYWIPLNSEFVKHSDKLHAGEEASHLIAFPKIAGILAPVIGAAVLESLGFDPLFILVILVMMISVVPLFLTGDFRKYFSFKFKDLDILLSKRYAARLFTKGGFVLIESIIWPVYIFLTFNDFMPVGIAVAVSGIAIAFFTLLVGKLSDRVDRRHMMKLGALGYAFIWFARPFAHSMLEILLLSFLGGMFMTVVVVNLFAAFCNFSRKRNILGAIVFREIWLNLGRVVTLLIVILALGNLQTAFLLGGVLCLLFILV